MARIEGAKTKVRPVAAADEDAWRRLYRGYADFYRAAWTEQLGDAVWAWLHDPAHECEGLVAERDGRVVGLAHYRRMPRPLRGTDIGFLDDLFVDPEARGSGAAEALIRAVADIARERGWSVVRWLTADDNYRARGLYDRLAKKSGFNLYEMTIE